jgi:hypothetical protein
MSALKPKVALHNESQRAEEDVKELQEAGAPHGDGDVIGYYSAGDRISAYWVGYWGLPF